MSNTQHPGSSTRTKQIVQADDQATREYLSFSLGSEEYGIDILKVQEIRGYESPTRIAGAIDFCQGILNLRGVIVPIFDLRLKFGLADVPYNHLTVTVILIVEGRMVGVVVDSVSDVVELGRDQHRPFPEFEFNSNADSSYITGIGTVEQDGQERMLILLDIEKLMSASATEVVEPLLQ